jgi:hypothetical protein
MRKAQAESRCAAVIAERYVYLKALAAAQVVGGYGCGGTSPGSPSSMTCTVPLKRL